MLLLSLAFMAFIAFLAIAFGRIGEFIALIFMVFNLGASAGTYPLETASHWYKVLHPFVPFTYSVNGFRSVITTLLCSSYNRNLILRWFTCCICTSYLLNCQT